MGSVVYTAVFGDYPLEEPVKQEGWKYLCYTDREIESDVWEFIKVETKEPALMNRYFKILNYHEGIYIDSDIKLLDANGLWKSLSGNIAFFNHNNSSDKRDCAYEEIKACIELKKASPKLCERIANKMRSKGYPKNNGLICGGVILRKQNQKTDRLMAEWFKMYVNYARRDQIYLNYLAWILNTKIQLINKDIRNNEYCILHRDE